MSIIKRLGAGYARNKIDAGPSFSLYGGAVIIIVVLCVYFIMLMR